MDAVGRLRRVGAGALFAIAALLLLLLVWPSGDPWSAIARVIVGAFVLPMAVGIFALGIGVLRAWRGSEAGALFLLAIAGLFMAGSAQGVGRWTLVAAVLISATPLVLLLGASPTRGHDR